MATLFVDFDYSDGQLGTVGSADWTVTEGNATWTETVGSSTLVISNNGQGSAVTRMRMTNLGTSGDVEAYARLKIGTVDAASESIFGPALIDASGNCYALYIASATTVRLGRWSGSSGGNQSYPDVAQSFTITADTYFKVRIGRSGTTIRAKIWADGDAEPGTWNAGSGTDSTLTTVYPGLWNYGYSILPETVDAVGGATGTGVSAPTSGSVASVVPQIASFYQMLRNA